MTDATFGFDTALGIATDAIDRLHSTAHSHHRIIVVEIMGHRAGWLDARRGNGGWRGRDPHSRNPLQRGENRRGHRPSAAKRGSSSASWPWPRARCAGRRAHLRLAEKVRKRAKTLTEKLEAKREIAALEVRHQGNTMRLARQLEELTHLESRVTILGYVQRGGTPCAEDRILATRLGSACADLINEGKFGVMVAARGDGTEPVPLERSRASSS